MFKTVTNTFYLTPTIILWIHAIHAKISTHIIFSYPCKNFMHPCHIRHPQTHDTHATHATHVTYAI